LGKDPWRGSQLGFHEGWGDRTRRMVKEGDLTDARWVNLRKVSEVGGGKNYGRGKMADKIDFYWKKSTADLGLAEDRGG